VVEKFIESAIKRRVKVEGFSNAFVPAYQVRSVTVYEDRI
jgi:hypothetical protein